MIKQSQSPLLFRISLSIILALILLFILIKNINFLTLCTGICIFLFAMMLLQESFKILSGSFLDIFVSKMTDKNYKSFLFGLTLSTLVQSSGLVSIIAISFLSAKLITLAAGIAMIYGVNLSTAGSAWIVGYLGVKSQISLFAMPLIVFGVIFFLNKHKKIKGFGLFLLSLGFLFLGISYMKEGFGNFKDSIDISKYQMQGFLGLITYVFIGLIITVITQSSHATLTLAITALSVGQISYENSIALAIGANVGSTMMTIIGSLNSNIEGKKLTVTHVLFNLIAAVLSIIFIKYYLEFTDILSLWLGILENDYVLKLAVFTTIFNVIGVVLLYPFISQMCAFLNYIVKENPKKSSGDKTKYLNNSALEFSDSALEVLYLESKHLLNNAFSIVAKMISLEPADIYSKDEVKAIIEQRNKPLEESFETLYHNRFKNIYSEIIDFAVRATNEGENSKHTTQFMDIRRANLFMATAVKDAKDLQENILKFAFSNNEIIKNEYSHLRRNLLRMLRLLKDMIESSDIDHLNQINSDLELNVKKYDAISSHSLDSLIRYKRITDSMATSIMNDTALARSIAKDLMHASKILTRFKNKNFEKNT
ncbi:Na/Pi cotransporter family protein [Campylobacter sp. US33a]|uniref:Na/Pi cotransporter family protein n=1 Tax=Campylobacter sp. US33a TaxID=2498120 RepID=UPI0010685012|nr:Na/Pi symporter [Campylobacter sp. US33a]TEY02005.1 Na/Pi cotransporter family protein [Campylobacter sp. US33a]